MRTTKRTDWARAMGVTGVLAGLGAVALSGCSAGSATATPEALLYVSSDLTTRSDLYVDPTVSLRPLTLAQLGRTTPSATTMPVEVEIAGSAAIVWVRRAGGEHTRSDVVGLFEVLDVVDARTIAGPTVNPGEGPVYTPGGGVVDGVSLDPRTLPSVGGPDLGFEDWVLIDWTDRFDSVSDPDAEIWQDFIGAHPGCA